MNKKSIITIATIFLISILIVGFVIAGPQKNKGKPQCRDGKDNDGDGLVDYPEDPGCDSLKDRDEYNVPSIYCGDGTCNGDETCETCSKDCGICPEPDSCTDTDGGFVAFIQGDGIRIF